MKLKGFWFHRDIGFVPCFSDEFSDKPNDDAILVPVEYHSYLFSFEGKGWEIVYPEEGDNSLPWLREIVPDKEKVRKAQERDIRTKRNSLLKLSDWSQLPDVPNEIAEQFKDYRQKLRDLTDQEGFPQNVDWPTYPSENT